jgi:hypothetical protein
MNKLRTSNVLQQSSESSTDSEDLCKFPLQPLKSKDDVLTFGLDPTNEKQLFVSVRQALETKCVARILVSLGTKDLNEFSQRVRKAFGEGHATCSFEETPSGPWTDSILIDWTDVSSYSEDEPRDVVKDR